MPISKGRRANTWRVTIYKNKTQREWIVEGTKREAQAFEARKRVALEAISLSRRTAPRFDDFVESAYAPHAQAHLRSSTWERSRIYQIGTLVEHFGRLKLTEIATAHVERFKRARLHVAAPSSINHDLMVLKVVLNFARANGYPCAPVEWKRLPEKSSGRVTAWSTEEIGRLFEAARRVAPQLVPMLVFMINTGCRKGEAIAAQWDWIDFERGLIKIPVTDAWRPKSGKPREIPMSRAVRAVLTGKRRNPRFVFANHMGAAFAAFPQGIFAKVRKAAGLVGSPHSTRHSFASAFLASCPDMFLLAKILGHSHSRVTEIYSHLLPDHLARALNAVDIGPRPMAMPLAIAGRSGTKRR
jgi:integrase